jgi:Reverse transcriptase (RNA-dependent DNA polymerase).
MWILGQEEIVIWQFSNALSFLNQGFEWVIDLDIEKYFDTVNHDKLISILRE